MRLRGHKGGGQGALVREPFVLMVSRDEEEIRQVTDLLQARAACALMTYESVEELVQNVPTGRAAVAILAGADQPGGADRALRWLGHRWPRCISVVVNEAADRQLEIAVRRTGAMYFVRPVSQAEWLAILDSGLKRSGLAIESRKN
jgi:FixJ family two-component response regulator